MKFALLSLLLPVFGSSSKASNDNALPTLNVHIVPHTHDDVGELGLMYYESEIARPLRAMRRHTIRHTPFRRVDVVDRYLPDSLSPLPTPAPP